MNNRIAEIRRIHELNDIKTTGWSSEELHYHQRVMSDLSPWLNAQGSAMLSQIIQEIELRGHSHDGLDIETNTNT